MRVCSLVLIFDFADIELCKNRYDSLPVSTMWQWWVNRFNSAVVILAFPNAADHSENVFTIFSLVPENGGMRNSYASDISPEKFEEILPLLQDVRRRTKPTTVDLYEMFCAVLYLLRTGCRWRFLPSDFPKWRTMHSYFAKWSEPG